MGSTEALLWGGSSPDAVGFGEDFAPPALTQPGIRSPPKGQHRNYSMQSASVCVLQTAQGLGPRLQTALWLCIRAQVVDEWIRSPSYELLERRTWKAIREAPSAAGASQ